MTTVIERLQNVSGVSGSRDTIQEIDAIRQSLLDIRSCLVVIDSAEIPRSPDLKSLKEHLGTLQKVVSKAENLDRESLTKSSTNLRKCRDVANTQVMSFEDSLGNLRQLAQTMAKDDPRIERIRGDLTQYAAEMENYRSRFASSASASGAASLIELKAACQKVRSAQSELVTELGSALGTTIRGEVLEGIGSCRPVALAYLTPEELLALRNSRLRDFLSVSLSPAGK